MTPLPSIALRLLPLQVLTMFEKAEAEYRTLTEKKRIVSNDKAKIQQVQLHYHPARFHSLPSMSRPSESWLSQRGAAR